MNDYYDPRTVREEVPCNALHVRRALNAMTSREECRFGPVRVMLHVSPSTVRYECLHRGERKNFRYSLRQAEDWLDGSSRIVDHDECIEAVVAFVLSHQPVEARAS